MHAHWKSTYRYHEHILTSVKYCYFYIYYVHYIIGTANLHAAMVVVCIVRNENVSWIFKAGKIDNWDPIPQGPLVSSCRFSLSPSRCWSSLSQVRCRLCTHWHPNSHDRWFPRIVKHSIVRPPKKISGSVPKPLAWPLTIRTDPSPPPPPPSFLSPYTIVEQSVSSASHYVISIRLNCHLN